MKRTLALRAERLTELTGDEMHAVAGANQATTGERTCTLSQMVRYTLCVCVTGFYCVTETCSAGC
jgi:hypothetical protein